MHAHVWRNCDIKNLTSVWCYRFSDEISILIGAVYMVSSTRDTLPPETTLPCVYMIKFDKIQKGILTREYSVFCSND